MSSRPARWTAFAAGTAALLVAVTGGAAQAATTPTRPSAATANVRCPLPAFGPGGGYRPKIEPAAFSPNISNPLFPLRVGRTMVYRGTKDGKAALDIFTVTSRTEVVGGVVARVVEDRLYLDNVLAERTSDYYAQDLCGNVWYFGEDTATLDARGHVVSTSGSFRAGLRGAQPGVFMPAHLEVGRHFRQEWAPGEAEDQFSVTSLDASVTVPYGSFRHTVATHEKTALEPGVLDEKQYVAGIGEVRELAVRGSLERLELVEIIQ